MERQYQLVCDLLDGAISNAFEWPLTQISRSQRYLTLNISEMAKKNTA